MPRVKRGTKRRDRRKKILAEAKGYFQGKSKLYRYAKEAVDRSQKFAYIGRKLKKRDFRSLWIIRISAGARQNGLSYSQFMHGLKLAGIEINRKMLSEMAIHDPQAFAKIASSVQSALGAAKPSTAGSKAKAEPKPATAAAQEKPAPEKASGAKPDPAEA